MALPTTAWNPGAPSRQVDPFSNAAEITPNDDTDLTVVGRGVIVGVGGNLAVVLAGMNTVIVLPGLVPGIVHPVRVRRVMSTDTVAEDIVVVW